MSAAVARGTHRLWDAPPWIVDDPFALVLVGQEWPQSATGIRSLMPPEAFRRGHLFGQIRSRYCEDRCVAEWALAVRRPRCWPRHIRMAAA